MNKLIVVGLLVALMHTPASAQESKDALIQKIYALTQDFSDTKIVPVRGGTKKKPLGVYLGTKDDVQFRSGYKDVEPKTQAEWAYDLNQFIVKNGGGWDNFQKYSKANAVDSSTVGLLNESLKTSDGSKDAKDPWDRAHVPYDKQAAFADKWWTENSRAYATTVVPPKDWWIHDAVLDGNNLWTRFQLLNGNASSDFTGWSDVEISKLLKKQ